MKVSIAILNYNSGYRLRQSVEAILKDPPALEHEVLVVDNASRDGSADFLREKPLPNVRFIESPVNHGFTGGYNLAFREARGEYFMTMNADLFPKPGAVDALARHLDEDASLGAAGGYVIDPEGRFEKYLNRFPRVRDLYLTRFLPHEKAMEDEGYRHYHMVGEDFERPVEVPQPAGHLLMVRKALYPEGLMSDEFGVFFSDVEMARKVYLKGKRIMVFPDAPFVHDHNHAKRPQSETGLLVDLDWYVGCGRYFRKYEGYGAYLKVKALFGARLLGRLLLVEFPAALRGEEPWSLWRARARLLFDFLRDHNELLARNGSRFA